MQFVLGIFLILSGLGTSLEHPSEPLSPGFSTSSALTIIHTQPVSSRTTTTAQTISKTRSLTNSVSTTLTAVHALPISSGPSLAVEIVSPSWSQADTETSAASAPTKTATVTVSEHTSTQSSAPPLVTFTVIQTTYATSTFVSYITLNMPHGTTKTIPTPSGFIPFGNELPLEGQVPQMSTRSGSMRRYGIFRARSILDRLASYQRFFKPKEAPEVSRGGQVKELKRPTDPIATFVTSTVTATSTITIVSSLLPTRYAACDSNNVVGATNPPNARGFPFVQHVPPQPAGQYQILDNVTSAYHCCVICMDTPNCGGSFFHNDGAHGHPGTCEIDLSYTCHAGSKSMVAGQVWSATWTNPWGGLTLSNGPCGHYQYMGEVK